MGDEGRFNAVMAVSKERPTSVYDAVVHLRTIQLVEDLSTEDGNPVNASGKAQAFMLTEMFESMVQCFAEQARQESCIFEFLVFFFTPLREPCFLFLFTIWLALHKLLGLWNCF